MEIIRLVSKFVALVLFGLAWASQKDGKPTIQSLWYLGLAIFIWMD